MSAKNNGRLSLLSAVALILSLSFFSMASQAASCCGGGFSIPALILGDDQAQLTGTYSYSQVTDDVLTNGRWLKRRDDNLAQTLKVEGALLLSDRWQSGFALPVQQKQALSSETDAGLGDVSLYLGHETFPETTYSRFVPKGVTFLQVNLPTSPSIYDTSNTTTNDIRGRGFYTVGLGFALLKSWVVWDANLSTELHRAFSRHATNASLGGDISVHPGWGASQNFGMGWNYGSFRLGSFLSFLYEEAVRIEGATSSDGAPQKIFTAGLAGSFMLNMESAVTLTYADQTLLGNPVNSSLSKTVNLSYQQRWPR